MDDVVGVEVGHAAGHIQEHQKRRLLPGGRGGGEACKGGWVSDEG
jgi:hypothetical protein